MSRTLKLIRLVLVVLVAVAIAAACAGWGWDDSVGTDGGTTSAEISG